MAYVPRRWKQAPAAPAEHFARLPDLPPFIAQVMYNRGLVDPQEICAFISESPTDGCDPFLMKDMGEAVARIAQAISHREPVVVYGDFDADGLTSTALMVEQLQRLGAIVEPYIPHRVEEGYGLNAGAIQRLAEQGTRLIITVDCGISSVEEIGLAAALGVDVVVTDHHHLPPELPDALAIICPRQIDCRYPFKEFAGVGVAYKLAEALARRLGSPAERENRGALDLVALGTVADMAPLRGENRSLVQRGLATLNDTCRPGLQAMLFRAGLQRVDAGSIAFALGPRLNATGRLDSAMVSYRLLVTGDTREANDLSSVLETANEERQRLTRSLQEQARQQLGTIDARRRLLIVAGPEYRAGVVGLVAGRLADESYRPAIVVEVGPETSRGSARSIPEFNIVSALDECRDLLVRYGGHAQAAGFTVANGDYSLLVERLTAIAERELAGLELEPTMHIDAELPLQQVTWHSLGWLEKLAPFGYANPTPILMSRRVMVQGAPRIVGRDHLKLKVGDGRGGPSVDAIGFGMGGMLDQVRRGQQWDVAYCLESNQWADFPAVLQLRLKDLRPAA